MIVGLFLIGFAEVVFLVLLYKSWASIQDGFARTSPGKAIGFLFIPIFNFYWVFNVMPGFVRDYNSYLVRANIPAKKISGESLQAMALLYLLSAIPFLGLLLHLILLFVIGFATNTLCKAINALPKTAQEASSPELKSPSESID
jgi:hypothetical protein